ncbi:MAG: hypothetical protein J1G01_07415, partial [Clostridiales bacterium]|nr:hypothetical protein [Clostridiales bacterium]
MSKGRKIKYIVCIVTFVIVSALLVGALYTYLDSNGFEEFSLAPSETMYVCVTLAVALPVLIVAFIFFNLRRKTHITRISGGIGSTAPVDERDIDKASKKEKKGDKERKEGE